MIEALVDISFPHIDYKLFISSSLMWLCNCSWSVGSNMRPFPSWISFHFAVICFFLKVNCNQSFSHLVHPLLPPWLLLGVSGPLVYDNICHEMSDCVLPLPNTKTKKKMLIIVSHPWGKSGIGMKAFY